MAASGAFVIFIDDDNVLLPTAAATYVEAITTVDADAVASFSYWYEGGDADPPASTAGGRVNYFPVGDCRDLALAQNTYGDANAIYRVDVIRSLGAFSEERGFACQDWDLFLRMCLAGKKYWLLPEPLFWYRVRADSMLRSSNWAQTLFAIKSSFGRYKFDGLDALYDMFAFQVAHDGQRRSWYYRLESFPHGSLLKRATDACHPSRPVACWRKVPRRDRPRRSCRGAGRCARQRPAGAPGAP